MSAKQSTFSICGMCTVRCPIEVETENGAVQFIKGTPYMGGLNGAPMGR